MENIDEIFYRKFAADDPAARFEFQESHWEAARVLLEADEQKRKRRRYLIWWCWLAGIGLLAGFSYPFWTRPSVSQPASSSVEERMITASAKDVSVEHEGAILSGGDNSTTYGAGEIDNQVYSADDSTYKTAKQVTNLNTLTNQADRPSIQASSLTNQADRPSIQAESLTNQADRPSNQADRLTNQAGGSSIQADSLTNQADRPSIQAESLTNQADRPSIRAESLTNQADHPSIQADRSSNQADSLTNQADRPSIQADSSSIQADRLASKKDTLLNLPIEPYKESKIHWSLYAMGTGYVPESDHRRWSGGTVGLRVNYSLRPQWSIRVGAAWRYIPVENPVPAENSMIEYSTVRRMYSFGLTENRLTYTQPSVHEVEFPMGICAKKKRWGIEAGVAPGILLWVQSALIQERTTSLGEINTSQKQAPLNKTGFKKYWLSPYTGIEWGSARLKFSARAMLLPARFSPAPAEIKKGDRLFRSGLDLGVSFRL